MNLKLKDLFNARMNKITKQVSLDLKKKELKKFDLDVDDIMELEINKKDFLK